MMSLQSKKRYGVKGLTKRCEASWAVSISKKHADIWVQPSETDKLCKTVRRSCVAVLLHTKLFEFMVSVMSCTG